MNKVKYFLLVFLLSPLTSFGYPKEVGNITHLQVHQNPNGDSYFFVALDSSIANPACVNASDTWLGDLQNEAHKAQYSTLLAAYLSGKEVYLEGTDGSSNCHHTWHKLRNVYIEWAK